MSNRAGRNFPFPCMIVAVCVAVAGGCSRAGSAVDPAGRRFSSADEAAAAFYDAVQKRDRLALIEMFGPDGSKLLYSGDAVADEKGLANFATLLEQGRSLEQQTGGGYQVLVGKNEWPFPIPIEERNGHWYFDTAAGLEEILDRRIGENELRTIRLLRSFVDAQRQYYAKDRDGDGIKEYAQKAWSSRGKQDGLYWEATAGSEPSPLRPLVASAVREGYRRKGSRPIAYQGYYFKFLFSQGEGTGEGKTSYLDRGKNLSKGFALLAYPARWSASGIMSFLVNHQGTVYQKDMGIMTLANADQMSEFKLDGRWEPVEDPLENAVD